MPARRRNSVLEALEIFRALIPNATINDMLAVFYVAENEGINVVELAKAAGMTVATASRVSRSLATALPPQAGLLEIRPNPFLSTGKLLFLSERGRAVAEEIDGLIGESIRIRALPTAA